MKQYLKAYHQEKMEAIVLTSFWLIVFVLIILQDFIYSILRHTGFYWTEVILFNSFWLLFIPTYFIVKKIIQNNYWNSKTNFHKSFIFCFLIFVCTLLHVLFFSSIVTIFSNLLFTTPHLFRSTFIASISNDLYLTVLAYSFLIYYPLFYKKQKTKPYQKYIFIKQGIRSFQIEVAHILYITTDKPYLNLYTSTEKILISDSLISIEKKLNPDIFLRVHRSTIINTNYIKELKSRKNGDYDVILKNNQTIRMSRHYRKNWVQLLSE